jgi:hypothetical protein
MKIKTQSFRLKMKNGKVESLDIDLKQKKDALEKDGNKYRLDFITIEDDELILSYSVVKLAEPSLARY